MYLIKADQFVILDNTAFNEVFWREFVVYLVAVMAMFECWVPRRG